MVRAKFRGWLLETAHNRQDMGSAENARPWRAWIGGPARAVAGFGRASSEALAVHEAFADALRSCQCGMGGIHLAGLRWQWDRAIAGCSDCDDPGEVDIAPEDVILVDMPSGWSHI